MGSEVEQELDDRWWLGLRGTALEAVDPQDFMVVLDFGEGAALTIESAASVRAASAPGTEASAVARNDDGTLSTSDAMLSLVGQRVLLSVGFTSRRRGTDPRREAARSGARPARRVATASRREVAMERPTFQDPSRQAVARVGRYRWAAAPDRNSWRSTSSS